MNNILQILESLGTGMLVGIVFSLLRLPIPAPGVLAGVMGIIGIFCGYLLVGYFVK